MKSTWLAPLLLLSMSGVISCGGGGGSKTSTSSGGTVTPPSSGGGNSSATATAVVVSAGSATSGVNITVPSGTAVLNARVLGVAPLSSSGASASNTGGVIQRGTQGSVLLFGKGLGGSLTVSVLGPNDLSISNIQGIKSTTDIPGVQFTVSVNSAATPGARTVVLQDAQGNITTFTGGLEIQ